LEFLLDIGINLNILCWLILDVWIQVLVYNLFELIEIINVLDTPVDGVLELSDIDIILSNLRSIVTNHINHVLLPCFKIINNITKVGIDLIVMT
jgi:hypothetical protein